MKSKRQSFVWILILVGLAAVGLGVYPLFFNSPDVTKSSPEERAAIRSQSAKRDAALGELRVAKAAKNLEQISSAWSDLQALGATDSFVRYDLAKAYLSIGRKDLAAPHLAYVLNPPGGKEGSTLQSSGEVLVLYLNSIEGDSTVDVGRVLAEWSRRADVQRRIANGVPALPRAEFFAGGELDALGDKPGALENYRKAAAGAPDSAQLQAAYARALERNGKAAESRGFWQRAWRVAEKDNKEYYKKLGRLTDEDLKAQNAP